MRVVQGCTIAVAQSRRKDAPTQTTANARMRDSACPKFRTMRNQQSKHDSTTPPHFRQLNERGIIFGAAGARTRNLRVVQGCTIAVAQSRYARMHKDSHTEPLHDATAQMAVIAQMQRHKWLSMHRCGNPNGGRGKDAYKQQLIQFFI